MIIMTLLALIGCSNIEPLPIAVVTDTGDEAGQWEPSGTIDTGNDDTGATDDTGNGGNDDTGEYIDPNDIDGDEDGFTPNEGDCNDNSEGIHPGADDICNGTDDDCDGVADENDVCDDGEDPPVDLDGDGYTADNDCDDNDSSTHPGATEDCDGVDNDCDGSLDDEWDVCWDAVYRFTSPTSETRCFGIDSTSVPSYCTGYVYEREAFVIAQQQFDGNVKLYSCHTGDDEEYWFDQVLTTSSSDKSALKSAGYTCSTVGYVWEVGDGPSTGLSPFSTCDIRRMYWNPSAEVGNGHLFSVSDNTNNLVDEGYAFAAESNHTCTL